MASGHAAGTGTLLAVGVITPLRWRLVAGDQILGTDDGGRTWQTITTNVSFGLS